MNSVCPMLESSSETPGTAFIHFFLLALFLSPLVMCQKVGTVVVGHRTPKLRNNENVF